MARRDIMRDSNVGGGCVKEALRSRSLGQVSVLPFYLQYNCLLTIT